MSGDYQIVKASIRHIRPMAKRMRPAAGVALEEFGFDPRRALHRAFMTSFYCRTAIMDDHPVAMWGAIGVVIGMSAYVWLVLSEDIRHMPRAILTEARRELGDVMERYPFISATVLPHDTAAVRFAKHLGFGGDNDVDDPLTDEKYRIPIGDTYAVRMTYRKGFEA